MIRDSRAQVGGLLIVIAVVLLLVWGFGQVGVGFVTTPAERTGVTFTQVGDAECRISVSPPDGSAVVVVTAGGEATVIQEGTGSVNVSAGEYVRVTVMWDANGALKQESAVVEKGTIVVGDRCRLSGGEQA